LAGHDSQQHTRRAAHCKHKRPRASAGCINGLWSCWVVAQEQKASASAAGRRHVAFVLFMSADHAVFPSMSVSPEKT
jgi:hypothetical protein